MVVTQPGTWRSESSRWKTFTGGHVAMVALSPRSRIPTYAVMYGSGYESTFHQGCSPQAGRFPRKTPSSIDHRPPNAPRRPHHGRNGQVSGTDTLSWVGHERDLATARPSTPASKHRLAYNPLPLYVGRASSFRNGGPTPPCACSASAARQAVPGIRRFRSESSPRAQVAAATP